MSRYCLGISWGAVENDVNGEGKGGRPGSSLNKEATVVPFCKRAELSAFHRHELSLELLSELSFYSLHHKLSL